MKRRGAAWSDEGRGEGDVHVHVHVHTCKSRVLKLKGYFLGDWVHGLRNLYSKPRVVKHAH